MGGDECRPPLNTITIKNKTFMKRFRLALTTADRVVVTSLLVIILAAILTASLTSCSRSDDDPLTEAPRDTMRQVTITFTFPDVSVRPMTRSTLTEGQMTDLWLFDYLDGQLISTIHQTPDDAAFGSIALTADYGSHQLYFVASRGTDPTISGTEITWAKPSDTFWASLALDVAPGMSASQPVALSRVATRLRVAITDEVPAALATLAITPAHWYCGLDYTTGLPTGDQQTVRTVSVPASYAGTAGQLVMSIFSLSAPDEWQTAVTVAALASDGSTLASLSLSDVPLRRNRTTVYSGPLFSRQSALSVTLSDTWDDDYAVSW